jgi:ubiquinone biosynthesis protein
VRNVGRDARTMANYMKAMPKLAHDILRQTAGGRQRLELRHGGFELLGGQLEKGVNRLTVGVVIAASIIAAAMILNSSQRVLDLPISILGVQTVSLTALLGIMGYVVATILGIWLVVSILRSGRL